MSSIKIEGLLQHERKIALSDVKQQLLYLLLMLSQKTGRRKQNWQTIELKLTHQDLANMIGATRETTSSIMSELKKDGFIRKVRFLALDAYKTKKFLNLS
ncbi:MAG: helix-turn-helix domain-containing protein [Halobacillus sp.]|uniref:helix-turn-helix domain-containing protein n=1 Tax=Halobacillus sp. TaxID=56800 RepID=UPI003BAF2C00